MTQSRFEVVSKPEATIKVTKINLTQREINDLTVTCPFPDPQPEPLVSFLKKWYNAIYDFFKKRK